MNNVTNISAKEGKPTSKSHASPNSLYAQIDKKRRNRPPSATFTPREKSKGVCDMRATQSVLLDHETTTYNPHGSEKLSNKKNPNKKTDSW